MSTWDLAMLTAVAQADDLHIAPRRPGGQTGTPTWIWSVRVDDTLYVRPYNGQTSSWYRSATETRAGIVQSGGETHDVSFTPVQDIDLLARVDDAYAEKYDGSAYLSPMVADGPRSCTVAVTPVA